MQLNIPEDESEFDFSTLKQKLRKQQPVTTHQKDEGRSGAISSSAALTTHAGAPVVNRFGSDIENFNDIEGHDISVVSESQN